MPRSTKSKTHQRPLPIISHRRDAGTGRTPMCDADPSLINLNKKQIQDQVNRRLQTALEQVAGDPPVIQKSHHHAHGFSRPLLHVGVMDYRNAGRYYQRVGASVFINYQLPIYSFQVFTN
jgi:hypothetical protein